MRPGQCANMPSIPARGGREAENVAQTRILLALIFTVIAAVAAAEPVTGLWRTEPDRKGHFGVVDVHECDGTICGRIVSAYNSRGEKVTSPNVGKLVFWGMEPERPGAYSGRAWVPAHDREYDARIRLSEGRLIVSGCLSIFCQSRTWQRVE